MAAPGKAAGGSVAVGPGRYELRPYVLRRVGAQFIAPDSTSLRSSSLVDRCQHLKSLLYLSSQLRLKVAVIKTIGVRELTESINEILCLIEEGEIIALVADGKVIAHIVPTSAQQTQTKQDMEAFWEKTDRLAAKISAYLPEKVDINDIMRDIRREF